MKRCALLICVAVVLLVVIFYSFANQNQSTDIEKVVDGDTIKLVNGEYIRLLGINAPEKGQAFYSEAKSMLEAAIANKSVRFEKDVEDRDKYGRLLRWVWADESLVNAEIVKQGLAYAYLFENTKYADLILQAEAHARENRLGLWSVENLSRCIGLSIIQYNAKGDDRYNLNDEYVVIKNACNFSIDMTGWSIFDASGKRFIFQNFSLCGYCKVTIYSGSGISNSTALFWNSSMPIWNNDKDIIYLKDALGDLVLFWSYTNY
ncbi:MAG: thermonuclease family protein [Candidatus Aenigmatarchaeota archaeon]